MSSEIYVALLRAPRSADAGDDWYEPANRPTVTVIETVDDHANTGILDSAGVPIYRLRCRVPMGFAR